MFFTVFSCKTKQSITQNEINSEHKNTVYQGEHMEVEYLPLLHPVFQNEDAILLQTKNNSIHIWDKITYKEIFSYQFDVGEGYLDFKMSSDKFIINVIKQNKTFVYNTTNNNFKQHDLDSISIFSAMDNFYLGYSSGVHKILDENFDVINSFKKPTDIHYHSSDYGLLWKSIKSSDEKFLKLYDTQNNQLLWQLDLTNHCRRIEVWQQYCLADERIGSKNKLSLLDLKNKKVLWTHTGNGTRWNLFDYKKNSIIISFSTKYTEIDLKTGKVLNEFSIKREQPIASSEKMMILDDHSIFFYNSIKENVIGEFSRTTGEINWEETFIPEECTSLNIWFWSKASNGDHLIFVQGSPPKLFKMRAKN